MTSRSVDSLVEALAADAQPVVPLASPGKRAAATLAAFGVVGGLAIALSDTDALLARHAGREGRLVLELSTILLTGLLAVTAAFFAAVPGRGRAWLVAAIVSLAAWLLFGAAGCYAGLVDGVPGRLAGESLHCFFFIVATGAAIAVPLAWRLSCARPIDGLHVALLAGLGSAALSAFLLAFFHPFAVSVLDLAVHFVAIGLVVAAMALLRRPALRPA